MPQDPFGFDLAGPQAPPLFGPAPAPAAPPSGGGGSKKSDWLKHAPLLAMLPLVLKKGGPQGMAAFLGAMQQGKQQQQDRTQQQTERQQQQDRLLANDQALADYRQQQLAQQAEQQRQAAELKKQAFLTDFTTKITEATTDDQVRGLIEAYSQFGAGIGVPPPTLEKIALQMVTPTKLLEKRVTSFLKGADKETVKSWVENQGRLRIGGQDIPFEMWSQFVPTATDASGKPITTPKPAQVPNTTEESHIADALAIAEEAKGAPLTRQEQARARLSAVEEYARVRGRADDRPPAPPNQGVQDQRRFSMEQRLVAQWDKANTPIKEMRRQLGLMETGLRRFRTGDRNGGAQAVLVTFQKILDPTSVVRESEYARTAAGQSLIARIEGFAERLASGGAGLTDAEMAAMVGTAQSFLSGMDSFNAGLRRRINATAQEYQLDPRMIFDDVEEPPAPSAAPGPRPGGGANPWRPNAAGR